MKQLLLICAVVALVGCGTTSWVSDPSDPNNVAIEKMIRRYAKKPTGELTKADLDKLTHLNLYGDQLTNVTQLHKLTQLKSLNLHYNNLTEVTKELEKLTQLTRLNLNSNQLTSVKGLEKFTKLRTLSLLNNKLTDVKGLEKLTQLTWLGLQGNQLTDVKELEKLTMLEYLDLYRTPDLTKAQIEELQKAFPNFKIKSNPTK